MYPYIYLLTITMLMGILMKTIDLFTVVLMSFIGILIAFVYYKLDYYKILIVMTFGLLLAFLSIACFHSGFDLPYNQPILGEGMISTIEKGGSFVVRLRQVNNHKVAPLKIRFFLGDNTQLPLGTVVELSGEILPLNEPTNPGETDFRYIQYSKGIVGTMKYPRINVLNKKAALISRLIFKVKEHFRKQVVKDVPEAFQGYVLGMAIGDKSLLDKNSEIGLRQLGLSHVLVVSSLHVGLFILLLHKGMSPLPLHHWFKTLCTLSILLLLLVISSSTISLLKCIGIYSIHLIGSHYNRKPNYLLALCLYAIISMAVNPYLVFNLSYSLSLMAYVGVFLIYRYTGHHCSDTLRPWYLTFCIYLTLAPIFIMSFGGFYILGLFISPLLMPFLELVIGGNFINSFIQFVYSIPFFQYGMTKLLKIFWMVDQIGQSIEPLFCRVLQLNGVIWGMFYCLLILGVTINGQEKRRKFCRCLSAIMALGLLLNIAWLYLPMQVTYLDVGMGDSQYIYQRGKSVLIDGGIPSKKTIILGYMNQLGQGSIDVGILSHEHRDHYGGMIGLMEEDKIEKVYMTLSAFNYLSLKKPIVRRYDKEGRINIVDRKTNLDLYDQWTLSLYPPETASEDPNNQSILCVLQRKELDFLFTGDAEVEEEEELYPKILKDCTLPIEYLKVAHHGSKTSSLQSFLLAAKPNYGMISVGKDNPYGLPDEEVIERYRAIGTKLRRTDRQGAFQVKVMYPYVWYVDY